MTRMTITTRTKTTRTQDDDDQDQDDYRNEQEDFGDDDEQDGHEDFHVDDNNGPPETSTQTTTTMTPTASTWMIAMAPKNTRDTTWMLMITIVNLKTEHLNSEAEQLMMNRKGRVDKSSMGQRFYPQVGPTATEASVLKFRILRESLVQTTKDGKGSTLKFQATQVTRAMFLAVSLEALTTLFQTQAVLQGSLAVSQKNGSGVQNSQNTTRKSTENPDPDLDDSLRLERRAYQKQDQNAYDVLAKHRASNKATRLPSAQILERCRRQQNLRDKLRDDQEKDDGDDQDDQDDQEEDDGDDQEEDDEEDTNQKSKRGRGRELLPTTEGFYPEPWPKVFARSRAPVYKYLVQLDFFPDRKEYKVTIADYLSDSIVFFVQDNDLYLDLSYYDEFRDDMLKMLVGFISTFRGRCMRQAREVIKQYYLHRIYTKPEDLPEAFNQEEYHQKTIQNVEKLLDRAFFLHDGRDEEVDLLGSVNNFMAPAIGDLAERILTMGKKTALFRTYPEIFDVYTSNFIAACSCLLRAALEEYRSGTPVEKPFSEEANSKFYKKAIYCIEKINRNDKHRRKTIGRWDKWAEEARKKRQRQVEKPMARDDEMDIDLD
ncbi:hypothetical protein MSAN_02139200 [Mycena sanguinolenta]|uniref:DUF6532 domain-containing protein n=1 Tax=Mycena sanguinolenta TaxID=230812 RepID=A0A8H6XHX0_9AGAR|nr:hypothetical protein MSAN_02139200 [Mycena sanguinolenta]